MSMRTHTYAFEVDATPEEVWGALHPRPRKAPSGERRVIEHGDVRIEIVHEGDENGEGLVRRCTFRVPRFLGSGGVGHSWECVTEVTPNQLSRYEAVGKPLWSEATGWHRLVPVEAGRTRVEFGETYHVFNPVLRWLLEGYVHRFISRDNDRTVKTAIEQGIAARRARRRPQSHEGPYD